MPAKDAGQGLKKVGEQVEKLMQRRMNEKYQGFERCKNWLHHCIAFTCLILFSAYAYAGKDPIGWSLSGSLPAQTIVNEQYTLTYTFVNNLPFTMPTPLFINKHPSSSEFTFVDGCSGLKLNPGQTCTVVITFFPTSAGQKSVSVDEDYGANVVPLPKLTTNSSVSPTPLLTGIVTTDLPSDIGTGEHRSVAFQFINNGNGTVLGPFVYNPDYPADGSFHEQTNDCATRVIPFAPGDSCTVTGILSARNVTTYTVGATYSYTGGSTTVNTNTATAQQKVVASVTPNPFPSNMGAGVATTIVFTFTNTGSQAVFGKPFEFTPVTETIGATFAASPNTYTCTGGGPTTNCSGPSLGASSSCNITCNFNPSATGNYTITGTFTSDGPDVVLQKTTNVGRVLTIKNFCSFDVWYSFNGAALPNSCSTNSDCPTGSSCSSGGQCFWTNPSPTSGNFHLVPAVGSTPSTSTVIIPDANPSNTTIWQGSVAGRTICSGTSCKTANCNATWSGDSAACDVGAPFDSPSTIGQVTLVRNSSDTYLVNLTNGFTIPTSLGPTTATGSSAYDCGTPGGKQVVNLEPLCTWSFTPPAPPGTNGSYVWTDLVTSPMACTSNATCTAIDPSYVCGLSFNPTQTAGSRLAQTCGPQLGYWTAYEACAKDVGSADAFFDCNTALTGSLSSFERFNLYACSPVTPGGNFDSCYKAGATTNCCGCEDWATSPMVTQACVNSNTQWTNNVLGTLQWIKTGCPSAQVYPFDTASSTFTCPASVTNNVTSYTISFCPT